MGLSDTPSSERIQIAFFGRRNAGKSSLINAISNQELSIVSDTPGTTTDPVRKTMELLPLGPVVLVDTPGFDDEGKLGRKRVSRARAVLENTDIAVLVADVGETPGDTEKELERIFSDLEIPYIVALTKTDINNICSEYWKGKDAVYTSTKRGTGIEEMKNKLASLSDMLPKKRPVACDLVDTKATVVLVIPIDDSAPKGRLILPQQIVLRDLLDHGMIPVCCRDKELDKTLSLLNAPPALVITDSQVFSYVASVVPRDIPLTSFSILMARYKGTLDQSVEAANMISSLSEQDLVLIAEGCTHHRQCEDIGTVKLPNMIQKYTGVNPKYEFCSGMGFPEDLSAYKLIIHCGSCMINEREAIRRYRLAIKNHVPMTNYGIAIAKMSGILERSLSPVLRSAK